MPLALFAQAAGSVLAQKIGGGGGGGLGGALGGALGGGEAGAGAGADVMPSDMSSQADGTFTKGNITINRGGGGANWVPLAVAGSLLVLLLLQKRR